MRGIRPRLSDILRQLAVGSAEVCAIVNAIAHQVGWDGPLVVLDCETTGFGRARVVELALVTLDAGVVTDIWESVLDPEGRVAATHIHGLTYDVLRHAPTFCDVAGEVAERMNGAVLVAHNLSFDLRMISAEFVRAGVDFDPGVGLDTYRLAGRQKLGLATARFGIAFEGAHNALNDALATAQLLQHLAAQIKHQPEPARFSAIPPTERAALPRAEAVALQSAVTAPTTPRVQVSATRRRYFENLDALIDDGLRDQSALDKLVDIAKSLGLDERRMSAANRDYLVHLTERSVRAGRISQRRYARLVRIAAALGVDSSVVERRTTAGRLEPIGVQISKGMQACITGDVQGSSKEALSEHLSGLGLRVMRQVSRATDVLFADDIRSQSANALRALRYGIPIASSSQAGRIGLGDVVDAWHLSIPQLVGRVCPVCRTTWADPPGAIARSRRCRGCRAARKISRKEAESSGRTEELRCESCGRSWRRNLKRGRKPRICPECRK